MLSDLRQRALTKLLGDSLTASVTISMGSWLYRQASEAMGREPELLDISTLVPGETYVVSTRPAPTRKERRAAADLADARRKIDRRTRPDRATRRTVRKLSSAQRRLDKAKPASARSIELEREVRRLDQRVEQLIAPDRRTRKLQRRAAALEIAVEAERATTMAKAARKTPPARSRTFR